MDEWWSLVSAAVAGSGPAMTAIAVLLAWTCWMVNRAIRRELAGVGGHAEWARSRAVGANSLTYERPKTWRVVSWAFDACWRSPLAPSRHAGATTRHESMKAADAFQDCALRIGRRWLVLEVVVALGLFAIGWLRSDWWTVGVDVPAMFILVSVWRTERLPIAPAVTQLNPLARERGAPL